MDAVISFLLGIVIFLFGFIWTNSEEKRYIRDRLEEDKKLEFIYKKKEDNEYYDGLKPVLGNVARLEKGNYIRKEESEMSDEERKFFEEYDKKIDKGHEKIINELSKRQAKNNDEIKKAKYKIDYLQDKKKHPAKMTEYIGLMLSFLSVIIGVLQLIQK